MVGYFANSLLGEVGIGWFSLELTFYTSLTTFTNRTSFFNHSARVNVLLLTPGMADEYLAKGTYTDSYWLHDDGDFSRFESEPFKLHGLEDIIQKSRGITLNPLDTASSWARDGITSALNKGFIPADLQNNYSNVITREEFCRMAVKWVEYALGKNIDTILAERGLTRNPNAFTDTDDPAILAAAALGITSGIGGGLFDPNGQFNREQAATMIMNTCKAIGTDVTAPTSTFSDIGTAAGWAVPAISFVQQHGIMSGTGGNNFTPKDLYTREMSIVTFNNIQPEALLK
jgi:hypothetical protein